MKFWCDKCQVEWTDYSDCPVCRKRDVVCNIKPQFERDAKHPNIVAINIEVELLKKRVAELEAALGEAECRLVTLTEENKVSFDSYCNFKVGQELIACTGGCATIILGDEVSCPNLYKWLKEKQK